MLLLSSYPDKSLNKLQLVLNTAARILTRTKQFDHITPVLASLHWLPANARVDLKVLLLTYKALHVLAPIHLSDLVLPYIPTHTLRSQDAVLLIVHRISKQTAGGRAFSYRAQFLWNGLPIHVREADSVRIIASVGPMIECSLTQGCEGERKGTWATNHLCCLCLAGSPLSIGILCL